MLCVPLRQNQPGARVARLIQYADSLAVEKDITEVVNGCHASSVAAAPAGIFVR